MAKAAVKLLDQVNKSDWPADNITSRKVADLKPYEKNARVHSPEQVQQIAAAIEQYGFTNRILIDERDNVIAGHGRIEAAKLLNLTEIPCIVAKGWTEDQRRAYVILDNQLTIASDWDRELLTSELQELGEAGIELESLGFTGKEIDKLLGLTDEGENLSVVLGADRHLLQIEFESEAECATVFGEMQKRGLKCAILT